MKLIQTIPGLSTCCFLNVFNPTLFSSWNRLLVYLCFCLLGMIIKNNKVAYKGFFPLKFKIMTSKLSYGEGRFPARRTQVKENPLEFNLSLSWRQSDPTQNGRQCSPSTKISQCFQEQIKKGMFVKSFCSFSCLSAQRRTLSANWMRSHC